MSQTYGKTSWKRFAVVMVPTVAATAAVGISMAQGALAASFAISGLHATVSAQALDGKGFTQYGTVDGVSDGTKTGTVATPVAVSGFNHADITGLCQSVVIPIPGLGNYTLKITGGEDPNNPVQADHIFLDMTDLKANSAQFKNINIGVAAGSISKGPVDPTSSSAANQAKGFNASFAQEADEAHLKGVLQSSYATTADSFTLTNMHLSIAKDDQSCTQPAG